MALKADFYKVASKLKAINNEITMYTKELRKLEAEQSELSVGEKYLLELYIQWNEAVASIHKSLDPDYIEIATLDLDEIGENIDKCIAQYGITTSKSKEIKAIASRTPR